MWNLPPTWTLWTIAAVVAATWLWAWALCRAAALGDDMVDRLLREVDGHDAARDTFTGGGRAA
jgi:hypothetical protein